MKAYLIFEDGSVYEGQSIGKAGQAIGEAAFTTAMTGYIETLTDPSFFGQMIIQTFPMIGNYGAMDADCESDKVFANGYIVREICKDGSNYRMDKSLNDFLIENNVVGICGIDTREITKKLREVGVMNAMISTDIKNIPEKLDVLKKYKITNAIENTSAKQMTTEGRGHRVVLWDFGAKKNIKRELLKRGCEVISVPYSYTAKQILQLKPQGVLLSNGGGDPALNKNIIEQIKILIKSRLPIFGICLGHQLLCLAAGAKTKKLKYGHRGENQPVRDTSTGRVYITSQNHGYAIQPKSLPEGAIIKYTNVNDKTCEGVDFLDFPAFSVQFHPEGCGGPRDTEFLFDRFIALISKVQYDGGKH